MKFLISKKTLTPFLILSTLALISCANTVDTAQPKVPRLEYKDYAEYSPFFAHQGDTVYVSGDVSQWSGNLQNALGGFIALRNGKIFSNKPETQKPIANIVFINTTTPRWESWQGTHLIIEKMRKVGGVSTSVIGDCGTVCAAIFLAGKERTLGQDLNGKAPHFIIQPPTHHKTGKLIQDFPKVYVAGFEYAWPKASDYRKLILDAITKPTDTKGGLTVGLHSARLCTSASSCKELNINMRSMGMLTSNERKHWKLPKRFPAPDFSQPSPPEVLAKSPFKNPTEEQLAAHQEFLDEPLHRAWAVSDDKNTSVIAPTAGRALKQCEIKSKGTCNLIAFNKTVFQR